MNTSSQQRLWAGFVASILVGLLLQALRLWASGTPVWPVFRVLVDVGFWFSMTSAVLLAVLALKIGVLVLPGSRRQARTALLVGLAVTVGLAFVVLVGSRNWFGYVASSGGVGTAVGFASMLADAFLGLVGISAGSLIALATVALLTSRPEHDDGGDLRAEGPMGDDESARI